MFDEEVTSLIKTNADVIEIQAQVIEQAARGILGSLKMRDKHRVLNNLVNLRKAIRKVNEEFKDLEFLIE